MNEVLEPTKACPPCLGTGISTWGVLCQVCEGSGLICPISLKAVCWNCGANEVNPHSVPKLELHYTGASKQFSPRDLIRWVNQLIIRSLGLKHIM